jgi:hypothetical protein
MTGIASTTFTGGMLLLFLGGRLALLAGTTEDSFPTLGDPTLTSVAFTDTVAAYGLFVPELVEALLK